MELGRGMDDQTIRQAAIEFARKEVTYADEPGKVEAAIEWFVDFRGEINTATCDACEEDIVAVVAAFEAGARWARSREEKAPRVEAAPSEPRTAGDWNGRVEIDADGTVGFLEADEA